MNLKTNVPLMLIGISKSKLAKKNEMEHELSKFSK